MNKMELEEKNPTSDFTIEPIKTAKHNIPQRKCQKQGILPKFPFSIGLIGRSGAGKTCCLLNILTRETMLKNYFNYILVYSPTCDIDDSFKSLKIPKENFVKKFDEDALENILLARKRLIKKRGIKWVAEHSRVLIILDDIICESKFMRSPSTLKMFVLLRHYLCSVIICSQSLTKIPRAIRLNCNALIIFPSTQSEVEVMKDELRPVSLTRSEFQKLVEYATEDQFSFLYFNEHAGKGKKIRKNLDEIIDIAQFKSSKK